MIRQKGNKLNFFGNISEWNNSGQEFIDVFNSASSSSGNCVDIDLHCYGGQVFEGAVIFNTIDASPKDVNITVVGLAASYGAIILLPAKKVKACENAMIMIHAPSTMAGGNSNDIKSSYDLLKKLESQFVQLFMKKTGQSQEDAEKLMDGKDHWYTAQEAKELGIVDEIIPAMAKDITQIEIKDGLTQEFVYSRFTAALNFEIPKNKENQNQKSKMDKKAIIQKYNLQGVTEASTDEQVLNALDAHMNSLTKPYETERDAAVDSAVNSAVASGKITAEKKDKYVAIGKTSGLGTLTAILDDINPRNAIVDQIIPGSSAVPAGEDRKNWTWDDYQTKAPQDLESMEKANPALLKMLYKAKYRSDLELK